jgi:adenylate kinase
VIYLTGAPATGKTTLAKLISEKFEPFLRISYGELLLERKRKTSPDLRYEELRKSSSKIIKAEDVKQEDVKLIARINKLKTTTNIIIDSHPVTKEEYGFRITPFDERLLTKLHLDVIIVLHRPYTEILKTLAERPEGRLLLTEEEARKHTFLLDAIASFYGIICGCPVYILNNDSTWDALIKKVLDVFEDVKINYRSKS